jgi:predicted ATPase/DNA-binding CsgD family transcriptional regulator
MQIGAASSSPAAAVSRRLRLPASTGHLFGREDALEDLELRIGDNRVLTICGPGGAGKTRLALALAARVADRYPGGVHWVQLGEVIAPGLVAQAVAAVVAPGRPSVDPSPAVIAQHLEGEVLLVLDNCEQVAEACATLLAELLHRCPELGVLATSQRSLGVRDELIWRIQGLAVEASDATGASPAAGKPGAVALEPGTIALEPGAVALFLERAQHSGSIPALHEPEARRAVVTICRVLDGMPLAIELAAARVPLLGAPAMATRLTQDIRILRQPRATGAPARQRALEATLAWSHGLLSDPERRVFARLGVFHGTFTLAAAEATCVDADCDEPELLDALESLVDCSLVQLIDRAGLPRFRLLGTVRQYAAAQLVARHEFDAVAERHAAYFIGRVAVAAPGDTQSPSTEALDLLESDRENLTAALGWLTAHDPQRAASLAVGLWPLWHLRGDYQEARGWFAAILERYAELPDAIHAATLVTAGEVAFLQCDYAVAAGWLDAAQPLARQIEDHGREAAILQRLGSIAREQGRYAEAHSLHRRSREIWQAAGDAHGVARADNGLGFAAWLEGSSGAAEERCAAALASFEALGARPDVAEALVLLGAIALYDDRLDAARTRLEEALELSRRIGFGEGIAWASHELGVLSRRRRRPLEETSTRLDEALAVHHRLGDRWRIASVLEEAAGGVLAGIAPEVAAQLLGAAEALRRRLGTPIPPVEADELQAGTARLLHRLGRGAFDINVSHGRTLEVDDAVSLARGTLGSLLRSDADAPATAALTERERAVLKLLSQGYTNREIGDTLFISQSTAGVHVSNILHKLGCRRRADAAARASQLGLLDA